MTNLRLPREEKQMPHSWISDKFGLPQERTRQLDAALEPVMRESLEPRRQRAAWEVRRRSTA